MDKRYEESLCFRLHNVSKMTVNEISKETGLSIDTVNARLKGHMKRVSHPSDGLGLTELTDFQIAKGIPVNTQMITSDRLHTSGITEKELNMKSAPSVIFEDMLQTEDDYFTLPDGRDETLFLHKNADAQREKIQKFIEEKYKGRKVKALYLSDLHIPFTMYDLVKFILNEHGDSNILIINGDLLDLFAVSTFAKDKTVALKRELQEGREFLEIVSRLFDDVIIVEGNHERRLRNYIKNVIPIDMHFLFPNDVLEVIQSGSVFNLQPLENVHVVGSWWIKLFDTIFAHPDNYSTVTMRTVINTSEHFALVKNVPHRACVIGHTHQAGKYIDRGRMVMETGCLNYDMDYKNGSKFGKTTWTRAYAVFNFDEDGQVSFNESGVITFGI